jgi:single-stranded-DNA-specific exonuclease
MRTAPEALAFLDPSHYRPSSAVDLPDMALAVERLHLAIERHEAILVWGDFDVDGITATALLVEALRCLDARVYWYIPNRERESHGVHWRSLQPFLGRGVRVLLTCDTGVSAHAAVLQAQKAGLDVVITDHHDLPASLPPALAVVNPKRLDSDHPLRQLSGAGVAYKLAEALSAGESGLDLAALGLVADAVVQLGDVRYLVQRGLQVLRATERVGVRALAEVADVTPETLDEDDISFALAPRLNALGRLEEATIGVELLLEKDLARARSIAAEAEALNVRRQFLSKQVTAAAQGQIERDPAMASLPVLVLTHPQWPSGILGIAASRLVERYGRPAVLIAMPPGEKARGSARSIAGVDVREALAAHSDLLDSFGGHPMAAGFSISPDRVPELRRGLIRTVADAVGPGLPEQELAIESYVSIPELTLHLAEEMRRLAPFGPGNPPVYLATPGLTVSRARTIGRTAEHRVVELCDDDGHAVSAFWWHSGDLPIPEARFDLAHTPRIDLFRGERSLRLEWVDARGVQVSRVEVAPAVSIPDVADYRGLVEPLSVLRALWEEGQMQVWAEAVRLPGFAVLTRGELEESPSLAVWTIPPATRVVAQALARARPMRVYLFAVDPGLDVPRVFVRRLAGLVKHAIQAYGGRLDWDVLAAAMAHRVETVRAGIEWFVSRGQLSIVSTGPEAVLVRSGGGANPQAAQQSRARLEDLLRETAAYRRFFRETDAQSLVGPSNEGR